MTTTVWAALFLAGLPRLGVEYYQNYLAALWRHTEHASTNLVNISFNGFLHRALTNAALATSLYLLITALLIIATFTGCSRQRATSRADLPLLLGLTLIPLISPFTEEHHLVVILLPLVLTALDLHTARPTMQACYVAALVLIASPYSWNRFALKSSPFLMPLLSAKIFGVLLLLFALAHVAAQQKDRGVHAPRAAPPGAP